MAHRVPVWLLAFLVLWPPSSRGQEEEEEVFPGDESALEDEQDFPDLVKVTETGGVMDEFALLEEGLSADVVESASKHRQSIFWSPSAVNVYTREDLIASGATSLSDFLRRVPGFDVYRLKPGFPLLGARAQTEESNNLVLLLVDGREAMSELTGFAFWESLAFDFEEIERVEVIRGPGSALYGANAFAAVVNVTTVPDKPVESCRVFVHGGEIGAQRLFARVQNSFDLEDGDLYFSLGAGLHGAGSPSDIGDVAMEEYRGHGVLRYRQGRDLDLSLHAGFAFGPGGNIFMTIGDLRLSDALYYFVMGKGEFALSEDVRLKAQIYHLRHYGMFHFRTRLRAYDIEIGAIPDFSGIIPTLDGQLQLDWQLSDDLLLIAGGNLRYTSVSGKNVFFEPHDQEVRGAVFAQLNWSVLEALQLTGGVRLDLNSTTGAAISPRAVAVYRPSGNHAFRLGYGLAFRKPTIYESQGHAEIISTNPATPEIAEVAREMFGNSQLGNEQVHSLEAGWRGRFLDQSLDLALELYYNMYRNSITFYMEVPLRLGLPDIVNSIFRYDNVGAEVDALGGEAEVAWSPAEGWSLFGNLGLRFVTEVQGGDRAPGEPVLRATLGGRYAKQDGLLAGFSLHYVSAYRMPLMDPASVLDPPELNPLGESCLLLSQVGYRVKSAESLSFEAGVFVTAPLGAPFREYAGAPMPSFLGADTNSDFGGEEVVRLVSFYLRGSF